MHRLQLTDLCDRLTTRLGDTKLTRYQLLDMATALMFMQRDLRRGVETQSGAVIHDLHVSLAWVRTHREGAPISELRAHMLAAMNAAASILGYDTSSPHPDNSSPPHQERVHA